MWAIVSSPRGGGIKTEVDKKETEDAAFRQRFHSVEQRRREGERSRRGESTLSPPRKTQSPPGDGEICGKWKSLLLNVSFYVFLVYVVGRMGQIWLIRAHMQKLSLIHLMWPWTQMIHFIRLDIEVSHGHKEVYSLLNESVHDKLCQLWILFFRWDLVIDYITIIYIWILNKRRY